MGSTDGSTGIRQPSDQLFRALRRLPFPASRAQPSRVAVCAPRSAAVASPIIYLRSQERSEWGRQPRQSYSDRCRAYAQLRSSRDHEPLATSAVSSSSIFQAASALKSPRPKDSIRMTGPPRGFMFGASRARCLPGSSDRPRQAQPRDCNTWPREGQASGGKQTCADGFPYSNQDSLRPGDNPQCYQLGTQSINGGCTRETLLPAPAFNHLLVGCNLHHHQLRRHQ